MISRAREVDQNTEDKVSGHERNVGKVIRLAVATSIFTLIAVMQSVAAEEVVNTGYFGDVAIKGYDTVAYFTENRAVQGSSQYSTRWLGATWYFASAESRDLFLKAPTKYAPQYGGHCADGVSLGTITTNIDPNAWRIIEGKLYLNYDPGTAEGFEKKPSKLIDAKKYWPRVEQSLLSEKLRKSWE